MKTIEDMKNVTINEFKVYPFAIKCLAYANIAGIYHREVAYLAASFKTEKLEEMLTEKEKSIDTIKGEICKHLVSDNSSSMYAISLETMIPRIEQAMRSLEEAIKIRKILQDQF